jgi:hypothetical protein
MRKTYKRLSALLLAVCLMLPCLLPGVRAADAAEPETFVYDFGTFQAGSSNPATVGAGLGNGLIANGSPVVANNTALYEDIKGTYEENKLHWYFEREYSISWKYAAMAMLPACATRFQILANEYVAFTIRNPGEGVWSVTANYPISNRGVDVAVYIVPGNTTDITAALTEENCLGTYNCLDESASAVATPTSSSQKYSTSLKNWTPKAGESYKLIFKSVNGESANKNQGFISNITLTRQVASVTVNEETAYYQTADAAVAAINAAESGTIALLADITSSTDIVLKSGVTLDLNGNTLTATVDATQGTVTDSSNGAGSIVGSSVVVKTGANEVAIKSGNTYKIFDYTMNVEETAEEKDNGSVSFWFKVDLSDAALGLIDDGTTDFAVGATMQWIPTEGASSSKNVALEAAEVTKWAGLMQEGDYWFYLNVTGFDTLGDVAGTLTVTPTISGNAGTPITYSVN